MPALQEWAVDELLDDITTSDAALLVPAHLPPKARFVSGKAVHVQVDGGA